MVKTLNQESFNTSDVAVWRLIFLHTRSQFHLENHGGSAEEFWYLQCGGERQNGRWADRPRQILRLQLETQH